MIANDTTFFRPGAVCAEKKTPPRLGGETER